MPPRKSEPRRSDASAARFALVEGTPQPSEPAPTAAVTSPGDASSQTPSDRKDRDKDRDRDREGAVAVEDLNLPKSIITRLAKGVLPPNTQIQANAILALSKSATVFINYLATHANENTVSAGKKTIAPADVFTALDETEFGFLRAPLEAEFAKFNAIQTEKRTSYRQKVRARKSDGPDTDMANATRADPVTAAAAADDADDGSAPRAKKPRVDPAAAAAEEPADAETDEDEENVPDEDDEDDQEEDEAEEEDEEEDDDNDDDDAAGRHQTQDALEDKVRRDDGDEALDGDESD